MNHGKRGGYNIEQDGICRDYVWRCHPCQQIEADKISMPPSIDTISKRVRVLHYYSTRLLC